MALRIDDEHALAREPPAGEPLEPLSNLLRQIRSRDVEAQLDRGRDLVPDEAEDLLRRRFAIVQVWRPIRHPVETFPLAICDARSLSPADLVISERIYPNRVGQTYAITYNPEHVWYWFPRMRREEALVFKVFDSATDGRARWTAHTAFEDPTAPPHARPRESIEIRTLAFF